MGSLYVGDLHPDVDEDDLHEIFIRIGRVKGIHLCRDRDTQRSLGYAYINYMNKDDAKDALRILNLSKIRGKVCRIMWSHSEKESRKTGGGNLFIRSLDKRLTSRDLYDIFSEFGNILSCKVAANSSGQSLGYGYVDFQRAEQAQKAVAIGNGMFVHGKRIQVSYFVTKENRNKRTDFGNNQTKKYSENKANLFITPLAKHVTSKMLYELFTPYGEVTTVNIERDKHSVSKCYGFVCYLRPEDARIAINSMNSAFIEGNYIHVGYAQSEHRTFLPRQSAVANATKTTTEDILSSSQMENTRNSPHPRIEVDRLVVRDTINIFNNKPELEYDLPFKTKSVNVSSSEFRAGNNNLGGKVQKPKENSGIVNKNQHKEPVDSYGRPHQVSKGKYNEPAPRVQTYKPKVISRSDKQAPKRTTQVKNNSPQPENQNKMYSAKQKMFLADTLFQIIFKCYPHHAFYITVRMLTELEANEIIDLLTQRENLRLAINQTLFKMRREY